LKNTDRVFIRQAELTDIGFIIEAIIEADRSETDRISYCKIFNLSLEELKVILRNVLLEDIEGSEFCLSNFRVALVDGDIAGACCSWIESLNGHPSYLIKFSLLSQYLNEEHIEYSKKIAPIIKGLNIAREKSVLQIESVYVNPNFRGLGISAKIINEHFKQNKLIHPELERAQLIVTYDNKSALSAYYKIGFTIVKEFLVDNEKILSVLPSNCLVLMERDLKDYPTN